MIKNTIFIVLACFFLSSCSIVSNNIRAVPDKYIIIPQEQPLHVYVNVGGKTFSKSVYQNYLTATDSYFKEKGVQSNIVKNPYLAMLKIKITRKAFEALPQEILTGFTFGIIPSWGKRSDKYIYTIEYLNYPKLTIHLDERTFNHLIFLPISLIELPFITESKLYKGILEEYLVVQ